MKANFTADLPDVEEFLKIFDWDWVEPDELSLQKIKSENTERDTVYES